MGKTPVVRFGFRAWMTAVAVLVVALTVATMLLYVIPVAGERLEGYGLDRLTAQAAETAHAVSEGEGRDLRRTLALAATEDREAVLVDRGGRVAGRAGPKLLGDDSRLLGAAAAGDRVFKEAGGLGVATVPVYYEGEMRGGVVLASRGTGEGVLGSFVRSSMEAALLASMLGGGLVLLLASLLGGRVERLAAGARAIEGGDLSRRIEPGFGDELGELAHAFNSMAARLQGSFSRLEERVEERTAELEAERARLEAVLRQMPSGVVIAEAPSGRVLLSNERAERIRRGGLPPAVGPYERNKGLAFYPGGRPYEPEDWPLARSIATGEEVVGEEIVFPVGEGEEAVVRVNSAPIRDPGDGRVVAGVAVLEDVTEQKRSERALREGEERFRAAFEQAAVGMAYDAPDGAMLRVNRRLCEILGYPEEEMLGRTFRDFTHPDDLEENAERVRRLLSGEAQTFSMEKRYVRKDGSVLWGLANASAVRGPSGETKALLVAVQDVTESKRAEEEILRLNESLEGRVRERTEELERERRTLDVVLSNLSEGVLAADERGRVVFANPAARLALGMDAEGLPEGVPDPWRADLDLPAAVARSSERCEGIVARVGGARAPLLLRLEPLPGFQRGRCGALVVVRDLSEGRKLEAEQQRFLANAAHELKTPLTAILGAAELLSEDDSDPEIRRRFLWRIVSEARRMRRLSETMLRLARTGTDTREPNLAPVDLAEVARRTAAAMETLARGVGLAIRVTGAGGRALADEEWLEEALLILLSNAIKHSGRGGRISVRAEGNAVAVEDEGEGISGGDLPHVFERFRRGKGPSEGFGLGLPICKELVERMGGKVDLNSEEGVGTVARIELPKTDEADARGTGGRGHGVHGAPVEARADASRGDGGRDGERAR